MPKYMRFAIDVEVEVDDLTTARSFLMDWTRDPDGEPQMMHNPVEEDVVRDVVQRLLGEALATRTAVTGVKLVSASTLPRLPDESGQRYRELPLPPLPVRRDDGSIGEF